MKRKPVTKEEFDKFLAAYPNRLNRDVLTICTPERIQYNDFTLGVWPDSVVADFAAWGCDDLDMWAPVPGNWQIMEELA